MNCLEKVFVPTIQPVFSGFRLRNRRKESSRFNVKRSERFNLKLFEIHETSPPLFPHSICALNGPSLGNRSRPRPCRHPLREQRKHSDFGSAGSHIRNCLSRASSRKRSDLKPAKPIFPVLHFLNLIKYSTCTEFGTVFAYSELSTLSQTKEELYVV